MYEIYFSFLSVFTNEAKRRSLVKTLYADWDDCFLTLKISLPYSYRGICNSEVEYGRSGLLDSITSMCLGCGFAVASHCDKTTSVSTDATSLIDS